MEKLLIFSVPVNPARYVDVYRNNIIGLAVDTPEFANHIRLVEAVMVAINASSQPMQDKELVSQDPWSWEERRKLSSMVWCSKLKIILGYNFHFLPWDVLFLRETELTRLKLSYSYLQRESRPIFWFNDCLFIAPGHDFTRNLPFSQSALQSSAVKETTIYHCHLPPMQWQSPINQGIPPVWSCQNWPQYFSFQSATQVYYSESDPFKLGKLSLTDKVWWATNNLLKHMW